MGTGDRQIVLPYAPRRAFVPYHDRTQRWACMVVHRRGGKTVACINDLVRRACELGLEHGRYAYIAPFLAQAKEVAWEYLKRYAQPLISDKNEAELWIEVLNKARIRIHGADNPDRLRGPYLDGCVCDEYGDWRPSVFPEVIRPMLADRHGWATFIGTPKGRNEFCETFERARSRPDEWYSTMLRASQTGILDQAELDDARSDMTPEQYAQEFECSFEAAILGAYFGKEIADAERDGRITSVPYDKRYPVYTVWDLGKGANMPVWIWQPVPKGVNVIDFVEGVHSDGIIQVCQKIDDLGYPIAADYVPHDAKATEISTGRTRIETLLAIGRNPQLVADHKEIDGINAARLTIPLCRFDRVRCKDGLEALRQFKADFDEVKRTFKDTPLKNWAKHPADAFRYLAMAWRDLELAPPAKPQVRHMMVGPRNEVTFNDMLGRVRDRKRGEERI